MRLRRVETIDLLNTQRQPMLPAGIFKGVLLRFWGVAQAGVTMVLNDFGTIIHRFRGKATQNWAVREAWIYTHLRGGRPEAVSGIGAAYAFGIVLPYCYGPLNSYNIDDNVLNVRSGEAFISIPGVPVARAVSAFCDVCVLEAEGAARYNPQIFATDITSTGQNRQVITTPNIRHFMLTPFVGGAGAQPNDILFTRDNEVVVSGDWNQLTALTDIDSQVEVGAAATGAIMPDIGNNNPATWTGGRNEVRLTGATVAAIAHFVEFGAEPITVEEHLIVNEIEANALATAIATSPMPFAEVMAPIDARKVLAVANQARVSPVVPQNREVAAVQAGPRATVRRFSARRR